MPTQDESTEIVLDETQAQEVENTGIVEVTEPAAVTAWTKPFTEYSVSEFLLLILVVLYITNSVFKLFNRKWGFPEW